MRHIALLMHIAPTQYAGHRVDQLEISNLDTMAAVSLEARSFVLTLELETDVPYVRGQLQSLPDRTSYPIQSNAALFDALSAFVAPVEKAK